MNVSPSSPEASLPRRNFLGLLGAGLAAATFPRMAMAAPAPEASGASGPMTAEDALERLAEGNERYISGKMHRHDFAATRAALARSQSPFAAVLSCADSRIGPEFAFDVSRGDLFVVRIAGNFLSKDGLASLEYTTGVLGTPLIMVLGHDSCGAIGAAIKVTKGETKLPGHLPGLVRQLKPAVKAAEKMPGDLLSNAIAANVIQTVEKLKTAGPVLAPLVEQGRVRVVGGIYRLSTGRVDILA